MEKKTTVYVKIDTDKEVRVEMTHVTEGFPTPHETNHERALTTDEIRHVVKRMNAGDISPHPTI